MHPPPLPQAPLGGEGRGEGEAPKPADPPSPWQTSSEIATQSRSKTLRIQSTDAEQRLWRRLRLSQLGVKFRRQHQLAGYIVDFVCLERWLVVELDGGQHQDEKAYDKRRTRILGELGFRVLRFWNNEALSRTDDVLAAIQTALAETPPPHPNPLPRRSRGRGSRERLERRLDSPSTSSRVVLDSLRQRAEPLLPPLLQAPLGGEGWGEGDAPKPAATAEQCEPTRPQVGTSQQATPIHQRKPSTPRLQALYLRAHLYRLIRDFFAERGVLEVETPMLSAAGNTDVNIESFSTRFSGHRDAGEALRWLRTSPEFPLKRLLAEGVGDCYELGRVFRNGEAGRRHNPEFSMLEWYRVGWDHQALLRETCALVQAALAQRGRSAEVDICTYRQLFLERLGLDPFTASEAELAAPLAEFGIDPAGLGRDDWLDLLITHRLQAQFDPGRITVIHDFPASQCALARVRAGEHPVAERFELYLGGYELANGYHELTDAAEQRARFVADNRRRRERGLAEVPLDERLLAALPDLPACAGVALGVERLLMCLAQTDDIRAVLAYAFAEA